VALTRFFGRFGKPFTPEERSRAYKGLFMSQLGLDHVLPDLAEFCEASQPAPLTSDTWVQARAAGRRDVFLHIQQMCHLSDEKVRDLYISRAKEL